MVEFFIVKFPGRKRAVILDGDENGKTNELLQTNPGTHRFRLGGPKDFKPESRKLVVENTTEDNPKIIEFEKIAAAPPPAADSGGGGDA